MPNEMQARHPFEKRTVGAIAAELPGATAVFRKHKLDFCCGGDVALEKAAQAKGAPLDEIVGQLEALDPYAVETPSDPDALIDHILRRYHDVHRQELPELVRLAKRVEAVHRDHPQVPAGLAAALEELAAELDTHMRKEEEILFPLMRDGGSSMIGHPIARMRLEHDDVGEQLRSIEALTHNCELPDGACTTWHALYAGVRKLIDDLMQHIHLENNVLFPQFATELPATPVCMGHH